MDILQAIILSIVEGITEFLPISSTGHLVLTTNLLGIEHTEFVKSFEIIIQLGAILAVVLIYRNTLLRSIGVWKNIIIAFLPTAVIGLILYSFIKHFLLGNTIVTLLSLFIGGIFLIVFERFYQEQPHHLDSIEKLSPKKAFFIGLFQALSVVPGTSRAATTIIGGLVLGLKRKTAVEFSFLLAIPTMLAATTLDVVKSEFNFSSYEYLLLGVGFIGSFITALFAVKFFIRFIQNHTFVPFGVYRIVLAALYWLIIIRALN